MYMYMCMYIYTLHFKKNIDKEMDKLSVMLSHFRIHQYFLFRLTRKKYPKLYQISTMGCVIKSSVAHKLRSD